MSDFKLLVLDDDDLTGQTIRNLAEFSGLQVKVTMHSEDFFKQLTRWQPTHIALDLVMPDMDGVQVLGQLGELGSTAQIILTSGVEQQVLQAAARSAAGHGLNIMGILPKPFNPQAFRTLIDTFITDPINKDISAHQPPSPYTASFTPQDLAQAIKHQQLSIAVQPKVDCISGALVGFEVLARWQHPKYGNIRPDEFIAIAEKNHLIDDLTQLIFELALPWFSDFLATYRQSSNAVDTPILCSLNISALSLKNMALFNTLETLCTQHNVPRECLMLELTETGAMDDPVASLDILTRLRMKGFLLSIDDFGTGFSSMLQLVRMPFSEVKVDKSFVLTAHESRESKLVIKAIIDLAHSLGMVVIAEGIEDQVTLEFLQQHGCDKVQGYYISRPLALDQVDEWLLHRQHKLEHQRLAKLHALKILDTPNENRFDRVTRLTKKLFNVPISLISFIDEDRQWFKSKQGLEIEQAPRQIAFCNQTIQNDQPLIIPDTHADDYFSNNPYVTSQPYVRFYAGYPLKTSSGERIGSLCILDDQPREFTEHDIDLLCKLGAMVEAEISENTLLNKDHLTTLLNRQGFEMRAKRLLKLCQSERIVVSMIYFDLDNFGALNAQHGRQAGDESLKQFSQRLLLQFQDADLIARMGSDEFAIILVHQTMADLLGRLGHLAISVHQYNQQMNQDFHLHYRYGIAITRVQQDYDLQQLYMLSDKAMHQTRPITLDAI